MLLPCSAIERFAVAVGKRAVADCHDRFLAPAPRAAASLLVLEQFGCSPHPVSERSS
jgi:hypothetical protein